MVSAVGGASSFSAQSLQQAQRQTPQERFTTSDTDSSGGLSLEEYSSFAPDFVEDIEGSFTNIDSDSDGSLTEAELKSFADAQSAEGGRPPPPPQGGSSEDSDEASLIEELLSDFSADEQQTINEFFSALIGAQEELLAA